MLPILDVVLRTGGAATPSFNLPLTTTLVPYSARGDGTPTFTRATTAYVEDHEGILRQAVSGEARFTGSRRVRNAVPYSQECNAGGSWGLTNILAFGSGSVANATTAPDGTTTADLIVPSTAAAVAHYITSTTSATIPGVGCFSVYVKPAGCTKVALRESASTGYYASFNLSGSGSVLDFGGAGASAPAITALSDSWYRISFLCSGVATQRFGLLPLSSAYVSGQPFTATWTANGTDGVYIWGAQIEDVTGQTTQTVGEYVSTNVLAAPYHGAGVDGVKYFNATLAGAAISTSTLLGYLAEGARTNICLWSNDIRASVSSAATSAWAFATTGAELVTNGDFPTVTTGWTGSAGATLSIDTARLKVESTTGSEQYGYQAITTVAGKSYVVTCDRTNGTTTGSLYVGTSAGASNLLAINAGPAAITRTFTATGTTTYISLVASGVQGLHCFFDNVSVKLATCAASLDATGPDGVANGATTLTAAAADATVIQDLGVIASAVKTFSIYLKRKTGTGNIDLTLDGGSTWTTKTITASWARYDITQTLADPDCGIKITTSGDEVYAWGAQVEAASVSTSAIPTTTAAVTRNADALTYVGASNLSKTAGTAYAEVTGQEVVDGNPHFIINGDPGLNSAMLYYRPTSGGYLRSYDGTNIAEITPLSFPVGTTRKVAGAWSGTTKTLASGTSTASSAFTTFAYTTSFSILGNVVTTNIRNVKIYPVALTSAQLVSLTT